MYSLLVHNKSISDFEEFLQITMSNEIFSIFKKKFFLIYYKICNFI